MKVFVAGATGAIGKQLVPRLVAAGHEVHGMTRSESKRQLLHDLGAVPVVADALDAAQVAEAVARATPDVIVHQLTAIPETFDMRHPDRAFELTNRLRTDVREMCARRPMSTCEPGHAGGAGGSPLRAPVRGGVTAGAPAPSSGEQGAPYQGSR